jgi:hypothetical protein
LVFPSRGANPLSSTTPSFETGTKIISNESLNSSTIIVYFERSAFASSLINYLAAELTRY